MGKMAKGQESGIKLMNQTLEKQLTSFRSKVIETSKLYNRVKKIEDESNKDRSFLISRSQELEQKMENMKIVFGRDRVLNKKIEYLSKIFTNQLQTVLSGYKNSVKNLKEIYDILYLSLINWKGSGKISQRDKDIVQIDKWFVKVTKGIKEYDDLLKKLEVSKIMKLVKGYSKEKEKLNRTYHGV